ncbi:response regulator transcription factor [Mesorhizobium sp. RP14(2022)]|uniref:Response regulator transcription factor n=1 Tax=Mesorhizobium liriopis TaxID=2953882 RepID=A0ABT1CBE3_9HYPH|nr:response regulator transcription factor [Mesorhizobium liriopis]MCO6051788.1 response regulator transcription factor [Mesorhizobium liriopis]
MTSMIRIAVIDDHPLYREGVTRSLSEIGGFQIVGEGSTTDDALRIVADEEPQIVLLDISLPGGGLNVITELMARNPNQKIVMLTVSEDREDLMRALKAGASGYVLKGVGARSLADIIRAIDGGEQYVSPALSARLLTALSTPDATSDARDPLRGLTEREREVLTLVASGMSNKRIGLTLDLAEKTIKHHMSRIMTKLSVANRTEAAMMLRDAQQKKIGGVGAENPSWGG